MPPLQRLEHAMHPFVTFVVLPVFALANAGVSVIIDPEQLFSTNIVFGVSLGLLAGKVIGVVGSTLLMVKLKVAPFPKGMNVKIYSVLDCWLSSGSQCLCLSLPLHLQTKCISPRLKSEFLPLQSLVGFWDILF